MKKIKTLIFMFMATALSKALALVRSMIFANYFGTGNEATAYFAASNILLQFLEIFLLSVICSTFIPVYAKIEEEHGRDNALKYSNNFMNVIGLIAIIISVLGIILAPYIVKIITPGFDSDTYILTVDLLRILFPTIIFGAMAYVCVAFLQSNFEFNIPNLISALFNIIMIGYLLIFGSKYGVYGLAVAMVIGWLGQVLIQVPSVVKHDYKFKFTLNFRDKNVVSTFRMAIPIMLVSLVNPIISMVNMGIASGIDNGNAVSAIEYSYSLFLTISAIFSYTIGSLIFPTLSKLNIKKAINEFRNVVIKSLDLVLLYSIPISIMIIICGKQIIKLLYERGEFTSYSTELTGGVLIIYCLAVLAFSINTIMNKCYYSMSKTKIPFITGSISIMVNILFGIVLSKYIGVNGIAFAYVISTFINAILLILLLNKKVKIINIYLIKQLFKNMICGIIMGICLHFINSFLIGYLAGVISQIIILIIDLVFGVGIYLLLNLLFRNLLVIDIVNLIKSKLKKCA